MSRRKVQAVILCEDAQQATLAETYLKSRGLRPHQIRTVPYPGGRGSGAKHVLDRYPGELAARRTDTVNRSLAVLMDEDGQGVTVRQRQMSQACAAQGIPVRTDADRVGVFIPARNVETWLRFLEDRPVNEADDYAPPGSHAPIGCKRHVQRLTELCARGAFPGDAPRQLRAACVEANRVLGAD